MKIFGRKSPSSGQPSADRAAGIGSNGQEIMHRLTRDLARAESLARMVAASRASAVVDVADFLAGMYIYEWERLSKFWEDREAIEDFLQRICQISPQRWHQWIEFYDRERREESGEKPRVFFGNSKNAGDGRKALETSRELKSVLRCAGDLAPHHDMRDGRAIPILTSECVLLCIAKNDGSAISQTLRETGLDLTALEQAARNPRHAPLHGNDEKERPR
jgi:hypothetical protein